MRVPPGFHQVQLGISPELIENDRGWIVVLCTYCPDALLCASLPLGLDWSRGTFSISILSRDPKIFVQETIKHPGKQMRFVKKEGWSERIEKESSGRIGGLGFEFPALKTPIQPTNWKEADAVFLGLPCHCS